MRASLPTESLVMTEGASPPRATLSRYSVAARWYHWLTAILMFAVIPLGWIFGGFKTKPGHPDIFVPPFPGTPDDYGEAHMTVGLVLLAIVVGRLAYRAAHRPPPPSACMPGWQIGLAHLTHWLLYAILVIMPISGYIMMAGDKPPIRLLGLWDVPKLPIAPAQGKIAAIIHVYTQFAVYALILLHLAGTAWHLFVRRDNALGRMLPPQDAA